MPSTLTYTKYLCDYCNEVFDDQCTCILHERTHPMFMAKQARMAKAEPIDLTMEPTPFKRVKAEPTEAIVEVIEPEDSDGAVDQVEEEIERIEPRGFPPPPLPSVVVPIAKKPSSSSAKYEDIMDAHRHARKVKHDRLVDDIGEAIVVGSRKMFECRSCGEGAKKYPTRSNLTRHIRTHSDYHVFECRYVDCHKGVDEYRYLARHESGCARKKNGERTASTAHTTGAMRTTGRKVREEFRCTEPKCGKLFTEESRMVNHLINWHKTNVTKPKKLQTCRVCAEIFPTKMLLHKHVKESHGPDNQSEATTSSVSENIDVEMQ